MPATRVREHAVNGEIVSLSATGGKDNGLRINAQSSRNRFACAGQEAFGSDPFAMEGGGVAVVSDENPRDCVHHGRVGLRRGGVVEIDLARGGDHTDILAHGAVGTGKAQRHASAAGRGSLTTSRISHTEPVSLAEVWRVVSVERPGMGDSLDNGLCEGNKSLEASWR